MGRAVAAFACKRSATDLPDGYPRTGERCCRHALEGNRRARVPSRLEEISPLSAPIPFPRGGEEGLQVALAPKAEAGQGGGPRAGILQP